MISKISVLIAFLIISAPLAAQPDTVSVDTRLQASDKTDCRVNDMAKACDQANRDSDEGFIGRRINLDGWIWANTEKKRKRFASLPRHQHGNIRNS